MIDAIFRVWYIDQSFQEILSQYNALHIGECHVRCESQGPCDFIRYVSSQSQQTGTLEVRSTSADFLLLYSVRCLR